MTESEKVTEPGRQTDDVRRSLEWIAFSGIHSFARAAFIVQDEEELIRMLDDVADEVMVQGLADELLLLLKELTQLIEARNSRL